MQLQNRSFRFLGLLSAVIAGALSLAAAESGMQEPLPMDSKVHHPWPGGVDPRPFITGITATETEQQLLLRWSGLGGPYRVEHRSEVASGDWSVLGDSTMETSAMVPASAAGDFFRIQGAPTADYVGASVCRGCHAKAHDGWEDTVHASALETLTRIGQGANSQCLPCHTVGYGLPGGFVSEAATPRLGGVQCENCHGPGGNHVADPGNLAVRPVVSLASMTCGGCHNDFHHPTYDEWLTSPHREVHEELVSGFLNPDVPAAEARMRSCGACHSGAVRLAMLAGAEADPPVEEVAMPSGDHAAHTGITCAVCHTAHEPTGFGSQLRNPPYSTNFFSYSTSTNTNFALQYNAGINLCGQCHNMRGARWQDTSRPPHHSPQYNVLVGAIGFDTGPSQHSTHRNIAKQCTHCHTHQHGPESPSEEEPFYTGHSFQPLPENCTPCHTPQEAETFIGFRQRTTRAQIAEVKELLDTWGETKAPEPLRTQYGKLAWEYNNAGQLSLAEDGSSQRGPTSAEQTVVPDAIKQARFLIYLAEHDGSYGVHNAMYTTHILNEAKRLVNMELAQE